MFPYFAARQVESSPRRRSSMFCTLLVGLGVGCGGTQTPLSQGNQVTAPATKAAPEKSASSKPSAAEATKPRNLNLKPSSAQPLNGATSPLVRLPIQNPVGLAIADDLPALLDKWQARENPLAPLAERFQPDRDVSLSWAGYLNGIHHRVHSVFADGWIVALESVPSKNPLRDQTLRLTVELQIEGATGRLLSANVLRASDFKPFDVGSLEALERASPFEPAPAEIIDAEGNVYMHWELHRRPEYACSTYFALPARRRTIE